MKKNAMTVRSDDEKRQDVFRLIRVVWRRWGPIALISGIVLATAGAAITIYTFKPVYEAKLSFRIIQNPEWLELAKGTGDKQDPRNVQATILSEGIARRVATEPAIAKSAEIRNTIDPVKKLRSMVSVKSEGGSELYAIAAVGSEPTTAALVAQEFWKQFNEYQDHSKVQRTQKALEDIEKEIISYNSKLKKLEIDLQMTFSNMSNSQAAFSFNASGDVASPLLAENELRSQNNKAAIEAAKRDIHRHSINPADTEYKPEDLEIELEKAVADSDNSLKLMEAQLADIGRRFGPSHQEYMSYENLVNNERIKAEKARVDELAALISRKRRDGEEKNKEKTEDLERVLEELEFNQELIDKDLAEEHEKVRNYKALRLDYDQKLQEAAIVRNRLLEFDLRAEEIRLKQTSQFSVIRAFAEEDEAVQVPKEPVEKYPLKLLTMIVGSSLLFPFMLAGLWEYWIKRVASPEQISGQTQLVGEIADLPARFNIPGRRKHQTYVFQESVNGFSTLLRARAPDEKIRSLAVTSAVSHEGKTTFASQLAISLARTSTEPILLIDCDLRKPSIHRIFDIELEPGAAAVLDGQSELPDAIVPSHLENLDLLPAGRMQDNPHRLLGQDRLAQLIRQAETKYSFIIVDTPPVLSASESLIAARGADAAVICVMKDSSRIDLVNRAVERLSGSKVNVMGFVFSGVPQREYTKRYGSYAYASVDNPRISNGEA